MALDEFGFKEVGLNPSDFMQRGQTIQLGQTPIRIDIVTTIDGVLFDAAWEKHAEGNFSDIPAYFISKQDLIKNIRLGARPQDIVYKILFKTF